MKKQFKFYILIFTAVILCIIYIIPTKNVNSERDFIKWVDFNVQSQTLAKVYDYDIKSYKNVIHYDFIKMLAYLTSQNGNKFNYKKDMANLDKLIKRLNNNETMEDIIGNNKYYKYYMEAYSAIFAEYIGYYTENGTDVYYGLKTFFPFAKGYWLSEGDDFGNSRNFGFKRMHLGHDMFGSVGTPIIAVEGGLVTELGWNRYGGWRIGIRSFDTKRYYYYAHLRKDKPYVNGICKGSTITAGQVIGYLGVTGYSSKENKNMKTNPHLHFGLQLIFDKSQEDGNGEIWIDVYPLCKFLSRNKASVKKDETTGDYISLNARKSVNV